jgi:hypothetical protein
MAAELQCSMYMQWRSFKKIVGRAKLQQSTRNATLDNIFHYSLRPILLFANMGISRHILVVDTSILEKSNMDRRE